MKNIKTISQQIFWSSEKKYVELIMRTYKTKKHYGEVRRILPRSLAKILRKYKKVLEKLFGHESYLFYNKSKTKLTRNAYCRMIQRCFHDTFGKKVGAGMLRVIYCSTMFSAAENARRKKASQNMLHSNQIQSLCYIKDLNLLDR